MSLSAYTMAGRMCLSRCVSCLTIASCSARAWSLTRARALTKASTCALTCGSECQLTITHTLIHAQQPYQCESLCSKLGLEGNAVVENAQVAAVAPHNQLSGFAVCGLAAACCHHCHVASRGSTRVAMPHDGCRHCGLNLGSMGAVWCSVCVAVCVSVRVVYGVWSQVVCVGCLLLVQDCRWLQGLLQMERHLPTWQLHLS